MSLSPTTSRGEDQAVGRSRRSWVRGVLAVVILGLAAMWVYVLFIAQPENPNRLEDDVWAQRAEAVCASVAVELDAVPAAPTFADIEPLEEALRQRAAAGAQADALLAGQLAQLRALPAPTGRNDGLLLDAWFADWDSYMADREAHIQQWRQGEDRPFAETEADTGGPISDRMDDLAKDNGMPSCVVPQDFG
jgi:hypothetical protein